MPTFEDDPVVSRNRVDNETFAGGVYGESTKFNGVRGVSYAPGHGAVVGISENHTDKAGPGVYGQSDGTGVWGKSKTWMGVYGSSESTTGGAGVKGVGASGPGVVGTSTKWIGVYGETQGVENGPAGVWGEHKGAGTGVKAVSQDGAGLAAYSATNEAIHAETRSVGTAAIAAFNLAPEATGAAIFAHKAGPDGHAGFFDGRVWVSGDLHVGGDIQLANADVAENFDVSSPIEVAPGAVVRIDGNGMVALCDIEYDTRVAGVISGAGSYRPGVLLDSNGGDNRRPVALFGKAYCQVDATNASINVGDLLTSSATPGFAMKATDRQRSVGAVVGKALAPLQRGKTLIPILVALG